MRWVIDKLAAFLALLCRAFDVPLENLDDGRRGNLPPPEGGISSTGVG
jgi:hypothetical protein